jgi:uncharacterized repeat protein (TIGR04076 family)
MEVNENMWKLVQERLGYSDREMAEFKATARNAEILKKAPEIMSKNIVAEVVSSKGCNSGHKVGDKFYMDGAGNLITKLCPSRMCIYAVSALKPLVYAAIELFYAGADPNKMLFRRTGCVDVGLECGGWGHIVLEVSMLDRDDSA